MFAIVKSQMIQQLIPEGSQFNINGTQYSSNWVNLSSPEDKRAIGMVDVVYAERPDDRYYWVTEASPVLANGVVRINYTSTPKDLQPLKESAISQVNQQAHSLLSPSDYMSIKALETDTPMSSEWKTWRESIRTTAATTKAAITASTDVDSLIVASNVTWPTSPEV